jgi:hypothetical protein
MVAIDTERYAFTIIELLSDQQIEVGDKMAWRDDTGLGSQDYQNLSKRKVMRVLVQNHWVSQAQLRQQLLMD